MQSHEDEDVDMDIGENIEMPVDDVENLDELSMCLYIYFTISHFAHKKQYEDLYFVLRDNLYLIHFLSTI